VCIQRNYEDERRQTEKEENNILRDEWRGVEGGMAKHQKKFRLL
jgi:hypothetical protein